MRSKRMKSFPKMLSLYINFKLSTVLVFIPDTKLQRLTLGHKQKAVIFNLYQQLFNITYIIICDRRWR